MKGVKPFSRALMRNEVNRLDPSLNSARRFQFSCQYQLHYTYIERKKNILASKNKYDAQIKKELDKERNF